MFLLEPVMVLVIFYNSIVRVTIVSHHRDKDLSGNDLRWF